MSLVAMFKGDYITGVELGEKKPTLTIKEVQSIDMEDEKTGKMKPKPVVFFTEIDRGWVLCKTTAMCIDAMFAVDGTPSTRAQLVGKRVTLKSEVVQVGPERKPAIRLLGSPDLTKPVSVKIKFPKKKAVIYKLLPTGKGYKAQDDEPLDLDGPAPGGVDVDDAFAAGEKAAEAAS